MKKVLVLLAGFAVWILSTGFVVFRLSLPLPRPQGFMIPSVSPPLQRGVTAKSQLPSFREFEERWKSERFLQTSA